MADDQRKHDGDDSDDGSSGNAADDPTAVWDAEALRKAGLDELGPLPEHVQTAPATHATDANRTAPSMVVDPRATGAHEAPRPAAAGSAKEASKELSWPATMGLALGLGGLVYLLIRFLR
ncbi:MAG: hypothetical protein QM778_19260 [Myxococcales bacterium]